MALESEKYVVLDNEAAVKQTRRGGKRREVLRRWFIECPRCGETWLAPGVRENDSHICRDCGFRFVKSSTGTEANQSGSF